MTKTFLESATAVERYAELAIRNKGNKAAFAQAWQEELEDNDVITEDLNETDILPTKIIGAIETAVKDSVVFKHFKPMFNVESGTIWIEDAENPDGAWGHTPLADKKVQDANLKPRVFMPMAIYKLQRLDHMTYLKGGALVAWVLEELPAYVLERLEQAILVGGVKNEDGSDFTAVTPILGDGLAYKSTLTEAAPTRDELFQQLLDVTSSVAGNNADKVIFMTPKAYATLVAGGDAFAVAIMMGQIDFGAGAFETTDILKRGVSATSGATGALPFMVVNPKYYQIGFAGKGLETLTDFEITKNAQVIESRAYVAGTMNKLNGAGYASFTNA